MPSTSASDTLERAIKERSSVRLTRRGIAQLIYGYPLRVGRELLLLQPLNDFQWDGYTVVVRRHITGVRAGEVERFTDQVVRDRDGGAVVRLPDSPPSLDDWPALFQELAEAGRLVSVENEIAGREQLDIGRVVAVSGSQVALRRFDPVGRWAKRSTKLPYAEITRVQFDTPYINAFVPYLRDEANPKSVPSAT